jgi:hypothetical protein
MAMETKMKISVTEEDIVQSAKLLELLKKWEAVVGINREYSLGLATFSIGENTASVTTDSYTLRQLQPKTAVSKCGKEIGLLVGSRVSALAGEVLALIKSHMPLPLSE